MVTPNSFVAMNTKFANVCVWLESLGVKICSTRISQYRKDIEELARHCEVGQAQALWDAKGFDYLVRSNMEIAQLNNIYDAFKHHVSPGLVKRLKKLRKGSPSLVDEKSDQAKNEPRNTAFELEIAAGLSMSGYTVNLEDVCDIWIEGRNRPIALECKRPFSGGSVLSNVAKGFDQLRQRAAARPRTWGILVLSVSRIENDGTLYMSAKDEHSMHCMNSQYMKTFIETHKGNWGRAATAETIAVLLHMVAPVRLETPDILLYSEEIALYQIAKRDSEAHSFIESFSRKFGGSPEIRMADAS